MSTTTQISWNLHFGDFSDFGDNLYTTSNVVVNFNNNKVLCKIVAIDIDEIETINNKQKSKNPKSQVFLVTPINSDALEEIPINNYSTDFYLFNNEHKQILNNLFGEDARYIWVTIDQILSGNFPPISLQEIIQQLQKQIE